MTVNSQRKACAADMSRWASDLCPLLEGCECYVCAEHFSRAYLAQLANTPELLARMLLVMCELVYEYLYSILHTLRALMLLNRMRNRSSVCLLVRV